MTSSWTWKASQIEIVREVRVALREEAFPQEESQSWTEGVEAGPGLVLVPG